MRSRLGIVWHENFKPQGWFDAHVRRPIERIVYPAWMAPVILAILGLAAWKSVDLLAGVVA